MPQSPSDAPKPQPDIQDDRPPYIDFNEPLLKRLHHLPHWQQPGKLYFITFHLGDFLPAEKLDQWRAARAAWMQLHPEPWNEPLEEEYHKLFSDRINEYLDAGSGSCLLRQPRAAKIVANALHFFDGQRYRLFVYVIMPNHVHVLIRLLEGEDIAKVLHSWKSYSAKQINRLLGCTGALWQGDYWERLIRSEPHFLRVWQYIRDNPLKAHLQTGEYMFFEITLDDMNENT